MCFIYRGGGGREGTASLFLIAWGYFGGDEHTHNTIVLLACFIVGCGELGLGLGVVDWGGLGLSDWGDWGFIVWGLVLDSFLE